MEMISRFESNYHATETPDAVVRDRSYPHSVDTPHTDDDNRHSGTCELCTEDGELKNDSLSSNNTLLLKKPSSSFDNHDYVAKINEFEFYVDMVQHRHSFLSLCHFFCAESQPYRQILHLISQVKEIARPGCSPEMLNVALSSLASLVKTLSMISSKQCLHASL